MDNRLHQRSAYWDSIKGFLIFLVVFGHYLYDYLGQSFATDTVVSVIYLFHMPAFVFISGFFTSREADSRHRSIALLLGAYVTFNTVMMFVLYITKNVHFSLVTPVYSYWYIVALIIWRATISKVEKVRGIFFISIPVALLAGCFPDVNNVLSISRMIAFYPFFLAGYFFPPKIANMFSSERSPITHFLGVVLLIAASALGAAANAWIGLDISQLVMLPYRDPSDVLRRAFVLLIAIVFIAAILLIFPSKPIPLLTQIGKNSFPVFLLHRFPTMMAAIFFPSIPPHILLPVMFILSVITVLVFGNKILTRHINSAVETVAGLFFDRFKKSNIVMKILAASAAVVLFVIPLLQLFTLSIKTPDAVQDTLTIVPPLRGEEKISFDNAVKLLFCGDLILLEEQVQAGKTDQGYDFSDIFRYTSSYIQDADIAVAVFEGPMAGQEASYTTGNFDDGRPLSFNFPDSFADDVAKAGFDLVTTANNHLLDKGVDGARRTLRILDEAGLDHVGSYSDEWKKQDNSILIREVSGVRFAFLAYTFASNGYSEDEMLQEPIASMTSIIPPPESANFAEARKRVEDDLRRAEAMNPDVIVVLPHMGTQFSHTTDNNQETWNQIFLDAGADIILGDHAHAVQPVTFRDGKAIINCPGNFVNSYTGYDGDASAITEIYIQPEDASILGVSIIPTYIRTMADGSSTSIPIYDLLTDPSIYSNMSEREILNVGELNQMITKVMLGEEFDSSSISRRYYITADGIKRSEAPALPLIPETQASAAYEAFSHADSVCFVGDSITIGSRCGGAGWYEPIISHFPDKAIARFAWDGATVAKAIEHANEIANQESDLYCIALGTNDVRYRDPETCAMTREDYITALDTLIAIIRMRNPDAEFILIAPWPSLENDPQSLPDVMAKEALINEYSDALRVYCEGNLFIFSNPKPWIQDAWRERRVSDYMVDHIHPNSTAGAALYSQAVLLGSEE